MIFFLFYRLQRYELTGNPAAMKAARLNIVWFKRAAFS